MLVTRIIGWPTFTHTEPLCEPHMPCAIHIFRPTRSMRLSTSPPLADQGRAAHRAVDLAHRRIRYPSATEKLNSPVAGFTEPPPICLA